MHHPTDRIEYTSAIDTPVAGRRNSSMSPEWGIGLTTHCILNCTTELRLAPLRNYCLWQFEHRRSKKPIKHSQRFQKQENVISFFNISRKCYYFLKLDVKISLIFADY